ncbi:hypothetical protein COOONC_12541 [Cooperia oncophora]
MKRNVDPCTDFFSFGCGSFAINRVVPEHERKVNVLSEVEKEHRFHLKELLEDTSPEAETKAMVLPRTYYNSCMDEDAQANLVRMFF